MNHHESETECGSLTTSDNIRHTSGNKNSHEALLVELRQKLMVADEVYLYRIPPLQTSGGHRAENWNLASPIATCSLLVERRGDCLAFEFRQQQTDAQEQQQLPTTFSNNVATPIFAQALIDCSVQPSPSKLTTTSTAGSVDVSGAVITSESTTTKPPPQQQQQQQNHIRHWIEGTIDSSRYFTLRISNGGHREALIGFGFRDRDQAIDLREAIQYYEASMRREYEAATISNNTDSSAKSKYTITKLADGERIHIRTGRSTGSTNDKSTKTKATKVGPTKSTGLPFLLKKPPSSASDTSIDDHALQVSNDLDNRCQGTTAAATTQHYENQNDNHKCDKKEDDDDDDWDAEFVSAN